MLDHGAQKVAACATFPFCFHQNTQRRMIWRSRKPAFFALNLFLITTIHATNFTLFKRGTSICGNGVVEADEQCDFNAPGSIQCCSQTCRRLPDILTECARDNNPGACTQGVCITRQQQCMQFNDKTLAAPGVSVSRPFSVCSVVNSTPLSVSSQDAENTCSLACSGKASSDSDQKSAAFTCLDLSLYNNVGSLVSDGLACGKSSGNSTVGICYQGGCRDDLCRATRCNNRGTCLRSSTSQLATVCACDGTYTGDRCQLSPSCSGTVDYCGVCNGHNDTCTSDPFQASRNDPANFITTPTFKKYVLPAVCVFGFLLLLFFIFFYIRHRDLKNPHTSLISSKLLPRSGPLHRVGISVRWDEFRCILAYEPQIEDELELLVGDIVFKLFEYDDGWAKGYNTRTQLEGIYPVSFTEKVGNAVA